MASKKILEFLNGELTASELHLSAGMKRRNFLGITTVTLEKKEGLDFDLCLEPKNLSNVLSKFLDNKWDANPKTPLTLLLSSFLVALFSYQFLIAYKNFKTLSFFAYGLV